MFESMSKDADETSMTAEASKAEATKRPEPAFRKPTQTREGRLRQRMVAAYTAALGGPDRITEIQRQNIMRAADLEMLASQARRAAARGEVSIGDVTRLEIQAHKAIRALNLPAPGAAAAPSGDAWREFLAGHEGGK
jgi:hypothetical protein